MKIQPSSSTSTILLLCIIILSTVFAAETTSSDIQGAGEKDRNALLAFKSNIKIDPQGFLASWNTSRHFCHWPGVTCGRKHERVTALNLNNTGLVGTLSPYIGNLSFLTYLNLNNNSLHGIIPSHVIARLVRLKFLYLSNNLFVGEIGSNIFLHCTSLIELYFSSNVLVGKIPDQIGYLSKLEILSIHENYLTGSIPTSIGNLTSLKSLSAARNKLNGDIPDVFNRLSSLMRLGLGLNELVGTIPASIYNLSRITIFSFGNNHLHGELPQDLGLVFPHLDFLSMWGNNFTGHIPYTLSNASKLEHLDLGTNNLDGKVVLDFSRMHKLSWLNILENNLAGDVNFLTSLLNCTNLVDVQLQRNHFGGELPNDVMGNNISSRITNLNIGDNLLLGPIPSWIGALEDLTSLRMYGNKFSGSIPDSLGMLKKLNSLSLYENKLSGNIPASIGNLSSLIKLYLKGNAFAGTLPPSLGNCQKLIVLDLSGNHLSGQIPKQLFRITSLSIGLDLSRNRFVGLLPAEIGNLNNIGSLYLHGNQLSGEIPSSIGGCSSLEILNMGGNLFQGFIPESFRSLKGVQALDLSHNNLTGKIPDYFEGFSLEYLNLSYNHFQGEVPRKGIFMTENATFLSLAGNEKLCGGVPQLKLPKCPILRASKKKKRSNSLLLLVIFASILFGLAVSALLFYYFGVKARKTTKNLPEPVEATLLQVSYAMLLKATNGFSAANVIGVGGFGTVYKGTIIEPEEQIVAVKVLNLQRRGSSKSFTAECEALRSIRHRSLVKVITSCSSVDFKGNDFKALVYEFMPNGGLDTWLHHNAASELNDQPRKLNLNQIANIVTDVASVLEYLHHQCQPVIIHCDLKPSNILLDSNMNAHVGDFGLAKILEEFATPNQSSSMGIRGTIGYTAPEYGIGGMVSASGDVYSFGIVLLEMITGRSPTSISAFEEGQNLHDYAEAAAVLPDHERIMEIVDPTLLIIRNEREASAVTRCIEECIMSMVKIGVACSAEMPHNRMNITDVVRQLHIVKKDLSTYLNHLDLRQ